MHYALLYITGVNLLPLPFYEYNADRAVVEYELLFHNGKIIVILYDIGDSSNRSLLSDIKDVLNALKLVLLGLNNAIILLRDIEGSFEQIICSDKNKHIISLDGALEFDEAISICMDKSPFMFL